ncbi:MAG: DUF7689 domain-containing protein, partial [Planctomycetaceae bacterium]
PEPARREYSLDAYLQAFATLGYKPCNDASHEDGQQKIALYCKDDVPQHAARQLSDGRWTSKCGRLDDVVHELQALEGEFYGHVSVVLSRPISTGA